MRYEAGLNADGTVYTKITYAAGEFYEFLANLGQENPNTKGKSSREQENSEELDNSEPFEGDEGATDNDEEIDDSAETLLEVASSLLTALDKLEELLCEVKLAQIFGELPKL